MQTLEISGFAEQTIHKSRFYAAASHCETEREVGAFLRALAAQHQGAHHLAYAYRVRTLEGIIPRFSDAGEPSGTAGKPILQMLEGRDLINVAVGVIRYYGGINLGTGGLARAYGGTAKMALQAAQIMPYKAMQILKISIHYNRLDELTAYLKQHQGIILDKQFEAQVHVQMRLPELIAPAVLNKFC